MKIAIVLNTRSESSEFQVEYDPPHTIELIKHGIIQAGHEYEFIEADENVLKRRESRITHSCNLGNAWHPLRRI
ncbi:MAG: hypothetical protein ACFFKA_15390 [Candidatus Thorarchaeota archaeon]